MPSSSRAASEERTYLECSICLSSQPKRPVVTCCGHTFCWTCIYRWYITHRTCPTCKNTLTRTTHFTPLFGTATKTAGGAEAVQHRPELDLDGNPIPPPPAPVRNEVQLSEKQEEEEEAASEGSEEQTTVQRDRRRRRRWRRGGPEGGRRRVRARRQYLQEDQDQYEDGRERQYLQEADQDQYENGRESRQYLQEDEDDYQDDRGSEISPPWDGHEWDEELYPNAIHSHEGALADGQLWQLPREEYHLPQGSLDPIPSLLHHHHIPRTLLLHHNRQDTPTLRMQRQSYPDRLAPVMRWRSDRDRLTPTPFIIPPSITTTFPYRSLGSAHLRLRRSPFGDDPFYPSSYDGRPPNLRLIAPLPSHPDPRRFSVVGGDELLQRRRRRRTVPFLEHIGPHMI